MPKMNHHERISLIKVEYKRTADGQNVIHKILDTSAQIIDSNAFSGGFRTKYHVLLSIFLGSRAKDSQSASNPHLDHEKVAKLPKRISMVARSNIDYGDFFYYDYWQFFKMHGFPVIPTMRLSDDGKYVFMTDLSVIGKVFGRGYAELIDLYWNGYTNNTIDPLEKNHLTLFVNSNKQLDSYFLWLYENHKNAIINRVNELVSRANRLGIVLPEDGFVLLLKKNNEWEIMMLDLEPFYVDGPASPTEVNDVIAQGFIWSLDTIYRFLKKAKSL